MAKTKKEKLEELDGLILDQQLEWMNEGKTEFLSDLTPTINYLRNNAVVAEKEKSTLEKDTKKRLAEAQKRRKKNESE